MYEAVGQALRIFREQSWCDQALRRCAANLVVRFTSPGIEHRVKISDFERWLATAGRSPAEMNLKSRLRDVTER